MYVSADITCCFFLLYYILYLELLLTCTLTDSMIIVCVLATCICPCIKINIMTGACFVDNHKSTLNH